METIERPAVSGIDVITTLKHFAILTYSVPPERIRPHVDPRFDLDTFKAPDGSERVWMSVVPFLDLDFHFARFPQKTFCFGQTNYRTYVIDRTTNQRAVWFFGTTLGGWPVVVPHYLWKLPWHYGQINFDCEYDQQERRYTGYKMNTRSNWAEAQIELTDTGEIVRRLEGFDDFESGIMRLTHPLTGVYYRRDGKLGSYHIWHDRLKCSIGAVKKARISLLDKLGIVSFEEQTRPHSVLIQNETEFIIKLPPKLI